MGSISGWIWRFGVVVGVTCLFKLTLLSHRSLNPLSKQDLNISQGFQRAAKILDMLKKQNDIKIALNEFTKQVKELQLNAPIGITEEKNESATIIADLQETLYEAQKMFQQAENTGVKEDSELDIVPSLEFEQTRRIIEVGVQETKFYLEHQLKNLKTKLDANEKARMDEILEEGRNHLRVVQYDLERLSNSHGLKAWRERESADLSNLVQKRLHDLQNPADCALAKKFVCDISNNCGFGCQIHVGIYCFIEAYQLQRIFILKSKGWRYHRNGWEDIYQPVSDTCTDPGGVNHSFWPASGNTQVVEVKVAHYSYSFWQLSLPQDLSYRIERLHGNPAAWWIGQFLKYMLRPQNATKDFLNSLKTEFRVSSPIVGIQIRRTDKVGTEAEFHSIDEYMKHVEEFYKKLALTKSVFEKNVYVATDDPNVWNEIREKFPGYTFLGDPKIAKTAAFATRYSNEALVGIIGDIHCLSLTDYLVCTFSSNVCRLAYEIMQSLHPDAANRFHSLDKMYNYRGQKLQYQIARFPHYPKKNSEMNLEVGDVVRIAGNHWNGYFNGSNNRTGQYALYPSYKMGGVVEL